VLTSFKIAEEQQGALCWANLQTLNLIDYHNDFLKIFHDLHLAAVHQQEKIWW